MVHLNQAQTIQSSVELLTPRDTSIGLNCFIGKSKVNNYTTVRFTVQGKEVYNSKTNFKAPGVTVLNQTSISYSKISAGLVQAECFINTTKSTNSLTVSSFKHCHCPVESETARRGLFQCPNKVDGLQVSQGNASSATTFSSVSLLPTSAKANGVYKCQFVFENYKTASGDWNGNFAPPAPPTTTTKMPSTIVPTTPTKKPMTTTTKSQ
ncbi:hypothetical protein TYRP_005384 [Tyrophagus putrescentiae]|nr:hypothetical protein TYRP_005384 [Tyrophagus putrescentiae]